MHLFPLFPQPTSLQRCHPYRTPVDNHCILPSLNQSLITYTKTRVICMDCRKAKAILLQKPSPLDQTRASYSYTLSLATDMLKNSECFMCRNRFEIAKETIIHKACWQSYHHYCLVKGYHGVEQKHCVYCRRTLTNRNRPSSTKRNWQFLKNVVLQVSDTWSWADLPCGPESPLLASQEVYTASK